MIYKEDEVFINKIGDTVMVTPIDALEETMKKGIELISDDFFEEGRADEIPTVREEFDDDK